MVTVLGTNFFPNGSISELRRTQKKKGIDSDAELHALSIGGVYRMFRARQIRFLVHSIFFPLLSNAVSPPGEML